MNWKEIKKPEESEIMTADDWKRLKEAVIRSRINGKVNQAGDAPDEEIEICSEERDEMPDCWDE